MPTPARRDISAIDTWASGSANPARAAARIFSRLRSASARLVGDGDWSVLITLQVDTLSVMGYSIANRLSGCSRGRLYHPPRPARGRPRKELSIDYRSLGRSGTPVGPYCLGAGMFGAVVSPDQDDSIQGMTLIQMAIAFATRRPAATSATMCRIRAEGGSWSPV